MIPTRTLVRFALIALIATTTLSCAALDVGHIDTLRSLQDDFNASAEFENTRGLHALDANSTTDRARSLTSRVSPYKSSVDVGTAERLHREYRGVFLETNALLSGAESSLVRDRLAVNALTLRLLARWRMSFYGHMVNVLRGDAEVTTYNPDGEGAPESLNAIVAAAQNTRDAIDNLREQSEGLFLYPRDEFIVNALASGAYVRFDIAYIRALRGFGAGQLGDRRPSALALGLMEEFARAESELASITLTSPHLRSHVARSRLLMLHAAHIIELETNFDWIEDAPGDALPLLRARRAAAFAAAKAPNDATGLRRAVLNFVSDGKAEEFIGRVPKR